MNVNKAELQWEDKLGTFLSILHYQMGIFWESSRNDITHDSKESKEKHFYYNLMGKWGLQRTNILEKSLATVSFMTIWTLFSFRMNSLPCNWSFFVKHLRTPKSTQLKIQLSPDIREKQQHFKYSGLLVLTSFLSERYDSFSYLPQTYYYFCTFQ